MGNDKKINVLQLIDSLSIGGAERMSVNLANVLAQEGAGSFLCATRKGGALERMIAKEVDYSVLQKRSFFDIKALLALIKLIKKHNISIVHAHSTSIFTAVLVKPFTGVKVIWHDHYGDSERLAQRPSQSLRIASLLVDAVISVNEKLATWSRERLFVRQSDVHFIPNFATLSPSGKEPKLPGSKETRIVCLANLREQKDHMTLLKAFAKLHTTLPQWHLLLVGEDRNDAYSASLKAYITEEGLEGVVHILGARSDSADILLASSIGVLSSASEGLPVALLEYGLAGLPVVVTNVGQCAEVVGDGKYGKLVSPGDPDAFYDALESLVLSQESRAVYANSFKDHLLQNYSQSAVIDKVMKIYGSMYV